MSQVFRVERTKNYTVMANYYLKDKRLSLKAKGLLSVMLSLPDDWNYNMKGLARLSKDGLDSVRSTVNELERYGYVTRHRIRTETGQLADTEYLVRERPPGQEEQPPALRTDSPGQENQLCFLQPPFGESCRVKMENVASPKWRLLQGSNRCSYSTGSPGAMAALL